VCIYLSLCPKPYLSGHRLPYQGRLETNPSAFSIRATKTSCLRSSARLTYRKDARVSILIPAMVNANQFVVQNVSLPDSGEPFLVQSVELWCNRTFRCKAVIVRP
jgi:hypothetical protein